MAMSKGGNHDASSHQRRPQPGWWPLPALTQRTGRRRYHGILPQGARGLRRAARRLNPGSWFEGRSKIVVVVVVVVVVPFPATHVQCDGYDGYETLGKEAADYEAERCGS
ncbi:MULTISPECIES: hypothetical protein [unclassified Bradyrhizobium]|uniref:hypothetical protein n=1 Tax=unclassified Bradyrhizobium TaxID=2631580 RepID=UPI001FF929EF|nr:MULTISPECIES: hypothetical protein [unclassified Bradyrhizobium]MCK1608610.1 hypothetical protein [Bradyrhizobium sp. 163]MCK1762586.1 hypothetical protein [Bradyrhizobium sp. 136]